MCRAVFGRTVDAGLEGIALAAGDPAAAPGTLTAASVAFGAGTGTINFNHTSADYVFAAVDSDPEAIAAFVRSKAPGAVRIGLETGLGVEQT